MLRFFIRRYSSRRAQTPLFYKQFLRSIRDTQAKDGAVPDTVPHTFGNLPADPAWGTAYPTILWNLYLHYGDAATLAEHYPNVKAWTDFLVAQANATGIGKMCVRGGHASLSLLAHNAAADAP